MSGKPPSRRVFCACCAGLAAWPVAATSASLDAASDGLPQALELGAEGMTRIDRTVWVSRIAPGVWLHTTTALIDGGISYPANGLILERPDGALLVDACFRPEQALALLAWSRRSLPAPITEAVATHFHYDRTGGIAALAASGVPTRARPATCILAKGRGLPVPEPLGGFIGERLRLAEDCELFFPGAGHTRDNIVVWLPRQRVLFGGCFLKSTTSDSLGNVADAVVGDWAASVRRLRRRYRDPEIVVPGHGTFAGDPIGRTLALLAASRASGPG